jgi:hypothetical protein
MTFYLGAPEPNWIAMTERPLCVSHTRLCRIRSGFSFPLSYPGGKWMVDSGAYELISRHGCHLDTPEQYVRAVRGYDVRIGNLQWAAPQDWPTEDAALARSRATVAEHIERSVQSYLDVTGWWQRLAPDRPCPFRPALQGRTVGDYLRCWDVFELRGVDLTHADLIAVGSICGRERSPEIADIVAALRERTTGRLHGFGVKAEAMRLFDDVDSMAWGQTARRQRIKHPDCTAFHPVCSSCFVYAASWHDRMAAAHLSNVAG